MASVLHQEESPTARHHAHAESGKLGIEGDVVFGSDLAVDGHSYVLDDLSGRYAPHEWAAKAIGAYHRHKADRIIAEINNGGAMVEGTIRAVDARVSYKSVHASRGKVVRAEPIAALYDGLMRLCGR